MATLLIAGVVTLVVFYLAILIVGVVAARCVKVTGSRSEVTEARSEVRESEEAVVAGRSLHGVVGVMTMIATTVGGGFINGTAESIVTSGLAWTISPFAITVGLVLGGAFFAGPMRRARYITMLQPVEERYGRLVACLVYLASLCGDVFWTAAILNALGTSLSVVVGLTVETSIVTSAGVTVLYTMVGQMISVAYTDVLQLVFITVGMVLCLPFIANNERVGSFVDHTDRWTGQLSGQDVCPWIDLAIAMILGTIPWQSYFQRVLSVRSTRQAQCLSVVAGFGSLLFAVPPFLIGAYSTVADWSNSSLTSGLDPVAANQSSMVLPLMLKEFTPEAVSVIGLGAVSAAVMSSVDSAVLGSSSMFTHTVYRPVFRPRVSLGQELLWVQRVAILLVAGAATAMAILVRTVWGLFVLAADVVYVIVLPQLTSALFLRHTNGYGALVAFFAGAALRIGAGEPTVDLPALIRYPYYDEESGSQRMPFRAVAFVASLLCLVGVSWAANVCFRRHVLPACCDVLGGRGEDRERYVVNRLHSSNNNRTGSGSGSRSGSGVARSSTTTGTSAAGPLPGGRKLTSKTDYVRESYLLHNPTYLDKY
ncbi:high-affinity choline transporter 1-like [Babylonia areolata]|uniref:high-affinity choline transporter 1-like n=1 Tax=Babylonia areolata TaxID=304850 RepID=UPI003FD1ECC2